MDKKICELLNGMNINFSEYETKDLSSNEKKRLKKEYYGR